MITQTDPDIRSRLDGVLMEDNAVAGLDGYPPPLRFVGFLVDGGGGDDLVGVPEDVDAIQDRTVAGDPGMEVFFLVDLLFPGKVEVNGVFYPDGVGYGNPERVGIPDDLRDGCCDADGIADVYCVHLNDGFRKEVFFPVAPVNAEKADDSQQEYNENASDTGV